MPTTANPTNCNRRGKDFQLYFNTGTDVTPVWVRHQGIIGDLTLGEVEDDEEFATRNPLRRVKEYIEGDIDINISGQQLIDEEYEGFLFLNTMREGQFKDIMAITNTIDTDGALGWRGEMLNKDRTWNGPTSGGMTQNFSFRPAACSTTFVRPVKLATSTPADWDPKTYVAPV